MYMQMIVTMIIITWCIHAHQVITTAVSFRNCMLEIPNLLCYFSVWFNSARVGLIVGFVAWFINYFPFLFIPQRYTRLSL